MVLSNDFEPAHSDAFRQAVTAQLNEHKAGVLDEFRDESEAFLHVVRLAINEAESLARSTPYAHLLLPVLIEEKIEHARRWARRQDRVSQQTAEAIRTNPD